MIHYTNYVTALLFALGLTFQGCGGSDDEGTTPQATQTQTYGVAQLGNLAYATVNIYKIDQNGSQTLKWTQTTTSGQTLDDMGKFDIHLSELEDNQFYLYEVIGGEDWDYDDDGVLDTRYTYNNGTIHAIANQKDIAVAGDKFKVSLASELAYELTQATLLTDFNASTFQAELDNAAKSVVYDIDNNGKINTQDVLIYTVPSYKPMLQESYVAQLPTLLTNIHEGTTALNNLTILTDTLSVAENNSFVATIQARDLEGDPLQWSIVGGDDGSLFHIDASSGNLYFNAPADFENPQNTNANNLYHLTLQVTDSVHTYTKDITVQVTNLNDNPPQILTSNNLNLKESYIKVAFLQGEDRDGDAISWSISGGEDSSAFSLDENSTKLTFITPPNYEAPQDNNGDNIYNVKISANDGVFTTTKTLSITVTDIATEQFIISVKTDNNGTTSDTEFFIPTKLEESYNYNVDCDNDGINEATGVDGNYTCEYSSAGTYQIAIQDNTQDKTGFPRIYFNNEGTAKRLFL